jgi:hypothetical protein
MVEHCGGPKTDGVAQSECVTLARVNVSLRLCGITNRLRRRSQPHSEPREANVSLERRLADSRSKSVTASAPSAPGAAPLPHSDSRSRYRDPPLARQGDAQARQP